MALLCPKQNELILDDGTGNGRFSIAIAKKGAKVVSLDVNKQILKIAAENFRKKKGK
jgi:ribosomal protein L11 methylase PrmA